MNDIWQNQNLKVEGLPEVESGDFHHHPLRYRTFRITRAALIFAAPVIVVIILILLNSVEEYMYLAIVLAVFIILGFISIFKGYPRRSYALRERDITYKKGWLFFSTTTIPFNRIQHSEVAQGPLERSYKLSTLKIYTAGGSSSDLSVPGLEAEEAQKLRDFIAKKASAYV